jgi:hypothetical protein
VDSLTRSHSLIDASCAHAPCWFTRALIQSASNPRSPSGIAPALRPDSRVRTRRLSCASPLVKARRTGIPLVSTTAWILHRAAPQRRRRWPFGQVTVAFLLQCAARPLPMRSNRLRSSASSCSLITLHHPEPVVGPRNTRSDVRPQARPQRTLHPAGWQRTRIAHRGHAQE